MITQKPSRVFSEYPPLSLLLWLWLFLCLDYPKPKVGPGGKDINKVPCVYLALANLPVFIGVIVERLTISFFPCFSLFIQTTLA